MIVRELISRFGFKVDKKQFGKAEKSFAAIKGAAIAAVAVVATGAFAVGVKRLLELGSDAAETMNVLEASFQEMTPAVVKWARETSRVVGRSEAQLKDFAGQAGAMLKPMLGSAKAAAEMSMQVAQLSVDLGSFFNVADPEALLSLKAGLIGSMEPMLKFGVVMKVASLDAFALEKGMGKTTKQMTQAELVALRFRFIMEKTKDAQGDAAKTSKGYANASKALAASIESVGTKIGTLLLPAAEDALAWMIKIVRAVEDWITVNEEWLQKDVSSTLRQIGTLLGRIAERQWHAIMAVRAWVKSLSPLNVMILKVTGALALLLLGLTFPVAGMILLAALAAIIVDDFLHWWENTGEVNTAMGMLDKALGGVLGTMRDMVKEDVSFWDLGVAFEFWADQVDRLVTFLGDMARGLANLDFGLLKEWIIGTAAADAKTIAKSFGLSGTAPGQSATATPQIGRTGFSPETNIAVNVQSTPDQTPEQQGGVIAKVVRSELEGVFRAAGRQHSVASQ